MRHEGTWLTPNRDNAHKLPFATPLCVDTPTRPNSALPVFPLSLSFSCLGLDKQQDKPSHSLPLFPSSLLPVSHPLSLCPSSLSSFLPPLSCFSCFSCFFRPSPSFLFSLLPLSHPLTHKFFHPAACKQAKVHKSVQTNKTKQNKTNTQKGGAR